MKIFDQKPGDRIKTTKNIEGEEYLLQTSISIKIIVAIYWP